jgi:lipopolysaccharide/colanic/teichoic acid biosynthesis glycosyltransferase
MSYSTIKATMDLVSAVVLLLLAAPVILVTVLLVKLTSRGPVFYSQLRLGKNGRPYQIYKIRTMYHNCEKINGAQWSTTGDPRITPVGRFLRKSHLDELPQLWNVLRGDMSLIGPRPERPEISASLDRVIPHYRGRLLVRPGMSGLAQVQLPPDTDLASVRLKLSYDLYYVQHMSFWMDVRLLFATLLYSLHVPFAVARWLFAVPSGDAVERPYRNWMRLGEKVTQAGWQNIAEAAKAGKSEGPPAVYDLDLSKMADDALAVLARACGYHPAANELALRQQMPQLELA